MSKTYERLNELLLSGLYLQKALEKLIDACGSYGNIHAKDYCTKKIEPLYDQWRLTTFSFWEKSLGLLAIFMTHLIDILQVMVLITIYIRVLKAVWLRLQQSDHI